MKKITEFAWITNITITKSNAKKHAYSWNEQAQKNHYLMEQIADFIKQLYEYYYLSKNEIKKLQKNISRELLSSFDQPLRKTEDIRVELHSAVLN